MTQPDARSLLFVCLGNICRSPLAEGIFLHLASERGVLERFKIDSAGTGGWHTGSPADPRSAAVAMANGIALPSRARQVAATETHDWDLVLAMDSQNRDDLVALGFPASRVRLMLECDPRSTTRDVPDPYYGGDDGFTHVCDMLMSACACLLDAELSRDASD